MTAPATWSRESAIALAVESGWDPLDLSLGVPAEPPPEVVRAIETPEPGLTASYPPSAGTPELRAAAAGYLKRRLGIEVPQSAVAACAGAKEFICTTPTLLRVARGERAAGRDVALIPALGYPPYEFGARLAGLRTQRVPTDDEHQMIPERIPDRLSRRALYLWVNSPGNPTGTVQRRLAEIVQWGRRHGVVILADEAYAELTWNSAPQTALANGLDDVLAVHSMSKRSNAPGLRVGYYAGDPELVGALVRLRREMGLIAAEASQRAAVRLLTDDAHAEDLYRRTAARVASLVELCNAYGLRCAHPDGSLFVWAAAPGGNGVDFARKAAQHAGLIVAAGITYGPAGERHLRLAAVHEPGVIEERLRTLAQHGSVSGARTS